jgi:hypothetical protein
MNTIEQLIREADNLAARYYNLAASDRERAARDWEQMCDKVAKIIQARSDKPNMNKKGGNFRR